MADLTFTATASKLSCKKINSKQAHVSLSRQFEINLLELRTTIVGHRDAPGAPQRNSRENENIGIGGNIKGGA